MINSGESQLYLISDQFQTAFKMCPLPKLPIQNCLSIIK